MQCCSSLQWSPHGVSAAFSGAIARAVLPVNLHGKGLRNTRPGAPAPSELMLQTLSNLTDSSRLLWVPFGVAYVFCFYTCWLLRLHFRVGPCNVCIE